MNYGTIKTKPKRPSVRERTEQVRRALLPMSRLDLQALADRVGTSCKTLERFRRGGSPRLDVIARLDEVLGND